MLRWTCALLGSSALRLRSRCSSSAPESSPVLAPAASSFMHHGTLWLSLLILSSLFFAYTHTLKRELRHFTDRSHVIGTVPIVTFGLTVHRTPSSTASSVLRDSTVEPRRVGDSGEVVSTVGCADITVPWYRIYTAAANDSASPRAALSLAPAALGADSDAPPRVAKFDEWTRSAWIAAATQAKSTAAALPPTDSHSAARRTVPMRHLVPVHNSHRC